MLNGRKFRNQRGVSLVELLVVLLILAIIVVLALPQIISSRRLFRFSGLQRQITATLRDTRQEAMTQRTPITFRYDDTKKQMIVFGGNFGAAGDARNPIMSLTGDGLLHDEVVYGRPNGASVAALGDGSNLTALSSNTVDVVFQPDGSVINSASNMPQNEALFFYNTKTPSETAFAVSILGAGGRVKIWRFSPSVNLYVE